MTPLSQQAAQEYAAGYRAGLAGSPVPLREKGKTFRHGWQNGRADRQETTPTKNKAETARTVPASINALTGEMR